MIKTSFCRQWESFRNLLNNRQRMNLSALLALELDAGRLRHDAQRIMIVVPAPKAAVFVYRHRDVLYLVGGHWLRQGEPTQAFLDLIRADIIRIKKRNLI
jgi:hypothetical protein